MSKKRSHKRRSKGNVQTNDFKLEQDWFYYFIAGYTDSGVPFGITWEEYYANKEEFEDQAPIDEKDIEDLPFD